MKIDTPSNEALRSSALAALRHQDFDMFERLAFGEQAGSSDLGETLRTYQAELIAQADEVKAAQARAEAGLQRFRQLFLAQPLACLVVDQDGRIADANETADQVLGLRLQDGPTQRVLQLMSDAESKLRMQSALGKTLSDGRAFAGRLRVRSLHAETLVSDVHLVRLEGEPGEAIRVLAIFVDQSANVRAQDELQRALELVRMQQKENLQLAMVARLTSSLVLIADGRWQVQWVNRAFEEATGHRLASAVGESPTDLLRGPDTDTQLIHHMHEQLQRGRGVERQEMLIYRRGGHPLWVDLSISVVRSVSGRVSRYICVMSDVTQRRQAEMAARESEDNIRAIYEAAPNCIAVLDTSGHVLEMNSAGRRLFARHPQEEALAEGRLADRVEPDGRAKLDGLVASALRGETARSELLFCAGERPVFLARTTCVPLRREGRIEGVVVSIEDVTMERQIEALRKENQIALEAGRARTEFLARVSHELRTPLNAILGFAQLLEVELSTADQGRQQERLQQILTAGWHLLSLITDVLDLTQVESDRVGLNIEAVGLQAAIGCCMAMAQVHAADAGVQLRGPPAGDDLRVEADPVRLKQVISNLLSNAIKYNRRDGWVEVRVHALEDVVWIEVADCGVGLTNDQLAHLYEPFNRLGAESTGIQGTGIGLVITRKLVESMQGCMQVASEAGAGSVFRVQLRRSPSPAAPQAAPEVLR